MRKRPNGQNRKPRPASPISALALDASHSQAHERATDASDALAHVSAPAQSQAATPSTGAIIARGWRTLSAWATGRDWTPWLLLAIALAALGLRLCGINWDANNHLHPDEREIVFRAMCLNFPGQPRTGGCDPAYNGPNWFFSPNSPLNPHFFAYGSFPLYLLAGVAHALAWLTHATHGAFHPSDGGAFDDFDHYTLIGRTLSALFDTGSVIFAGLIARR
ncbi:MAG TPA: hypothetical protein VF739_07850, partial [Ktedonobacterales bacterium]